MVSPSNIVLCNFSSQTESNLGEEAVFLPFSSRSHSIPKNLMVRTQQSSEVETMKESCILTCSACFLVQPRIDYLPRGVTMHRGLGLGPPSSIIIQENGQPTGPEASLMKVIV